MEVSSPGGVSTPPPVAPTAPLRQAAWYHWRRWGLSFLTISILAHVLFGMVAAYFIVKVIQPPHKQAFAGGAPPGNPAAARAVEHKVSLIKRQASMSAPSAVKRVTTTGVSRVALPAMPQIGASGPALPGAMGGMGGTGVGLAGLGGSPGAGGGGPRFNVFGSRAASPGFVGTFYDLKQSGSRRPTGMTLQLYGEKVAQFARGGFNPALLASYYKADKPIYATRIFTPSIDANLGPAAFGVENEVEPRLWLVHYKATVVAPESGTFRFMGMGDDVLMVKFNQRMVLDANWQIDTRTVVGQTNVQWDWGGPAKGATVGAPFKVEAAQAYPVEVLIGEQPGGHSCAALLIQKEGQLYEKDKKGANLLPFFRTAASADLPPPPPGASGYAPHALEGPCWKTQPVAQSAALFSH